MFTVFVRSAFLCFVAAVAFGACAGKTSGSSGPPIQGDSCGEPGDTLAFAGCVGCVCEQDRTWHCGTEIPAGDKRCCTAATYGMPYDPGTGHACQGACQVDYSSHSMICVPATSTVLARLGLQSLDGAACANDAPPGSTCAESCLQGNCSGTNASAAASCVPKKAGATSCDATCDGDGNCTEMGQCPGKDIPSSECAIVGCAPLGFAGCREFPSASAGVACSNGNPCVTGEQCDGQGGCGGGTETPGCWVDASASAEEQ
jgi:hypothetical protein